MQDLRAFQKTFQHVLDAEVARAVRRSRAMTRDPSIRSVVDHAAAIVRHDGKRFRPYLAQRMYRLIGGRRTADAMQLSVALELFHAFALVHDDIMDRGVLRHGLPTVHCAVAFQLTKAHRLGDLPHVGESQAILAGDLLFAWAHAALESAIAIPSARIAAARRVFGAMAEEVIIGQMIDVDLATRRSATAAQVIEKMYRKTAGYTFVKPLQFGATLAGADARTLRWCDAFGTALGLAFQIQDDLLDLTASAAQLHKTPFSDLAEHQQTLFTQHVEQHGTATQRAELQRVFGRQTSEKDRRRVTKLFTESGAFAAGQKRMDAFFAAAEASIASSGFSRAAQNELKELVSMVAVRNS